MTKKLIGILVLLVAALAFGLHQYFSQPKNIFDEIYQETKKTYQNNNVLEKIKDFDIRGSWPSDDSNISKTPFGIYNNQKFTASHYYDVSIDFNFKRKYKTVLISFNRELDSKVSLSFWSLYSAKEQTLTKTVEIRVKSGDSDKYIEDQSKVKAYLSKYGITASDLDKHYNEIVNQKVLKDWCSIYDSKFSPKDYGDVTVKTEWENW
ncbi:hypothetical protein SAMN05216460_0004 [Streptococcus sp. 45]|uniref:TipC family immunity protein n=1 Tax=Streptococcus sp. 45 TaxID=1855326 RepID=UPI0008BB63F8|nr:TipC family immunity protein [Streptococcus sp. 45]SEI37102.1 hypothetical protein SAMN05216460_0004 [Streptococcus sp. 45]